MKVTGLVPARFLTITSHLVLVVVIFWTRKPNIEACLPDPYTQAQYDEKDLEMIVGLSVALGLFLIELIGFFGGLTMFTAFQSLLSTAAHAGATVALTFFLFDFWPCTWYWYIFGFCSALPGVTEIFSIISSVRRIY